jgi:hypothetical protein
MKESDQSGYKQRFGCCADIPRVLLHTGDRWDYPGWYIDYITGVGNKKLPSALQKLLSYLDDETWKLKVAKPGIGEGTIEASRELELVDMSPVAKPYRSYVASADNGVITDITDTSELVRLFSAYPRAIIAVYRITERGKLVLDKKSLP